MRRAAAIPYFKRAIRLSPHDPNIGMFDLGLGFSHLLLGHLDEAIDYLLTAGAANPRFYHIHLALAGALGRNGDLDEAKAAVAGEIKLKPEMNSLARWRVYQPHTANFPGTGRSPKRRPVRASAARVFPNNDCRQVQPGCGCISKPAGRPARLAASAGGNAVSQRLAS